MDIYKKLGVKNFINAVGTVTKVGGSLMDPMVMETMNEASKHFVEMDELHTKAGAYIAKLLDVEACSITCGAAAGITITIAACMTGLNSANCYQLPDTKGMKNEVLALKCHRILYDQAIELSGAKVKEIGTTSFAFAEQIEQAISENTAAFFYVAEAETMRGSIHIEEVVKVCKSHNIPVIVDAAAELPPVSNIHKYLQAGVSAVIFSGGKEIRGPQSSGIILGKKDLIAACDLNAAPNYGVGRPMKIDKEGICGIVKAVELFIQKDYTKQLEIWNSYIFHIIEKLKSNENVELRTAYPNEPGVQPVSILRLFIKPRNLSAELLRKKLHDQEPGIYTNCNTDEIIINPQCLLENEVDIIIEGINSAL